MAPKLTDPRELLAAGINPRTGLPIKYSTGNCTKDDIKKLFRIIDEQDAVNRYTWYNLPCNLSSQELERLLYYKYTLCFFRFNDEFFFMPYALDGSLDFYNRFNGIHPVPIFAGDKKRENLSKAEKKLSEELVKIKLNVVKGIILDDDKNLKQYQDTGAVILTDYINQWSTQNGLSRQVLNDPLLDMMSDIPAYLSTYLVVSSGVKGVRVNSADEAADVIEGANSMDAAAKKKQPFIPLLGSLDFQELGEKGANGKVAEFFLALQSLDNLRLSTYGLDNGGLFEKKAHTNDSENAINGSTSAIALTDGLQLRQKFCNIVNSIWDCGVWVEVSETASMQDTNMDGEYDSDMLGSNTGIEGGDQDASSSKV